MYKNRIPIKPGQKWNRLTALEEVDPHICKGGKKHRRILCSCECGSIVAVILHALNSGRTKSCGCLAREMARKNCKNNRPDGITHGMSDTVEYMTWQAMKQRCYNPKTLYFDCYGGRGITVCDRWINSFENFYADMGFRPIGKSIDRIDNDGNYDPSNCEWRTPAEQTCNRRPYSVS